MKDNIAALREIIDQLLNNRDQEPGRQELTQRLQKELDKTNFRLDRSFRQRHSLTTFLARTSEDLEKSSEVIKKMFGRYLSNEVMNALLDDPTALDLGGERRMVTIMMTDLRGFTALSEQLSPEKVVTILNSYFEVMVDVILEYGGTINEIIGDALLVIFGAPQEMEAPVQCAVACAIEMQNAMAEVNQANRQAGLPELEMGIGLNETEVVVGNIGSAKRSKYAVVGSGVNMTSRIESYSVGGQILISESVHRRIGHLLRIEDMREVMPKGSDTPLKIYQVSGIAGEQNLALTSNEKDLISLRRPIPISYQHLQGKNVDQDHGEANLTKLSKHGAFLNGASNLGPLTNIKMNLVGLSGGLVAKHFYGKVMEDQTGQADGALVRFTSVPPEVDAYLEAHLGLAAS